MNQKEQIAFDNLKTENADLKNQLQEAINLKNEYETKLNGSLEEAAKTIIDKQAEKISQLELEYSKTIEELSAKIADLESKKDLSVSAETEKKPQVTVAVDEDTYAFTKDKFRIAGNSNLLIASEVAKNADLVKQILSIEGQSLLVKK